MTVRASKFPSVQLEDRQRKRYERSQQPEIQKELCKCLSQENIQNMINIRNGDPKKLRARSERYKEEHARRIKQVLL